MASPGVIVGWPWHGREFRLGVWIPQLFSRGMLVNPAGSWRTGRNDQPEEVVFSWHQELSVDESKLGVTLQHLFDPYPRESNGYFQVVSQVLNL